MAIITSTSHADLQPRVLANEIYVYTLPNCIAGNEDVVDTRFESVKAGQNIDIVMMSSYITPTARTEGGGDITPSVIASFSGGKVTIPIDQYFAAGYQLEVFEDAVAGTQFNIEDLYNQAVLDGMIVKIDSSITTEGSGFTTNIVGTLNLGNDEYTIRKAVTMLKNRNVPRRPQWNCLVSPDEGSNLLGQEVFKRDSYTGSHDAVREGEFTHPLLGVKFHETTQVAPGGSGGHKNYLLHKEAIALVMREEPQMEVLNVPFSLSKQVSIFAIWGKKRTRDDFGVLINGL